MASVTASLTFFRTIGGVLGVAIYGSILNNEIHQRESLISSGVMTYQEVYASIYIDF